MAQKKVVLLGGIARNDVVMGKVESLGHTASHFRFYHPTPNFIQLRTVNKMTEVLRDLHNQGNLAGVLVMLTERDIWFSSENEDRDAWTQLLAELKKTNSIILIDEDHLTGQFGLPVPRAHSTEFINVARAVLKEYISYNSVDIQLLAGRVEARKQQLMPNIKVIFKAILSSGVEVFAYKKRYDAIMRAIDFLDEVENGIFLRLYVPNNRYNSDQFGSFLRVFEDYLQRVEGRRFSINIKKTGHGVIYVFQSKDGIEEYSDISNAISRFESFMDFAQNNPAEAENILAKNGISSVQRQYLVAKYSREYQRIKMDIRHETQGRLLALQQQMESEVFELTSESLLPSPHVEKISSILSLPRNAGPVNVNISNINIQNNVDIQSTVGQVVNGDITYTNEDRQLIELFDRYAEPLQAIQLKSDLEQLKDDTSPKDTKRTAKQKIITFLYKTASAVKDTAVDVAAKTLAAYLESLTKGTPVGP